MLYKRPFFIIRFLFMKHIIDNDSWERRDNYGFFRTFNTKSSDHDLFDLGGRLLKRKVESSTVTHIDHQSLIAQIADFQLPGGSGGGVSEAR